MVSSELKYFQRSVRMSSEGPVLSLTKGCQETEETLWWDEEMLSYWTQSHRRWNSVFIRLTNHPH